jgi:hypothetical protein
VDGPGSSRDAARASSSPKVRNCCSRFRHPSSLPSLPFFRVVLFWLLELCCEIDFFRAMGYGSRIGRASTLCHKTSLRRSWKLTHAIWCGGYPRKTRTPQSKQCHFQTIVRYALSRAQLVQLDLLINGLSLRNKCLGWYVLPPYLEDDLCPSRN